MNILSYITSFLLCLCCFMYFTNIFIPLAHECDFIHSQEPVYYDDWWKKIILTCIPIILYFLCGLYINSFLNLMLDFTSLFAIIPLILGFIFLLIVITSYKLAMFFYSLSHAFIWFIFYLISTLINKTIM